jgi:hypothetical protein
MISEYTLDFMPPKTLKGKINKVITGDGRKSLKINTSFVEGKKKKGK